MRIPSSSALPLVRYCQASWALPHAGRSIRERSRMGDALHEHSHDRTRYGIDGAMARIELLARKHQLSETEAGIFAARCRHFEWVPPVGSYGEVALCLLEDGRVVTMRGGKGRYEWPEGAVAGGTLDLMWCEQGGRDVPFDMTDPTHPRCPPGALLWCPDIKTGEQTYVETVEDNFQILTNAMLAARWTGARAVVPAVVFWRKGQGEWDVPVDAEGRVVPWGEAAMRRHETDLRALMRDVAEQQRRAAAGEPLDFVEGRHCEFCPARARCPEHTALLKAIASGQSPEIVPQGDAPLTQEQRVWLAARLGAFERTAKSWRSLLIADVQANGPIVLQDGTIWGPHPRKKTTVAVDAALPVLQEQLGSFAEGIVSRSIPADNIKTAIREMLHAAGKTRGVAPIERRVYAGLGAAGALVTEEGVQYGAHKTAPDEDDAEPGGEMP